MERRHARRPPQHPLVLVADRDADTRELYSMALRSFGFEAETVEDVADVYTRAWKTHPDVITTEISLPPDHSWTVLRDLERDPRTRDIPVVFVTSQGHASVRERAVREGCAAFLVKPCLPDDLAAALRNVLKGRAVSRRRPPKAAGRADASESVL